MSFMQLVASKVTVVAWKSDRNSLLKLLIVLNRSDFEPVFLSLLNPNGSSVALV